MGHATKGVESISSQYRGGTKLKRQRPSLCSSSTPSHPIEYAFNKQQRQNRLTKCMSSPMNTNTLFASMLVTVTTMMLHCSNMACAAGAPAVTAHTPVFFFCSSSSSSGNKTGFVGWRGTRRKDRRSVAGSSVDADNFELGVRSSEAMGHNRHGGIFDSSASRHMGWLMVAAAGRSGENRCPTACGGTEFGGGKFDSKI